MAVARGRDRPFGGQGTPCTSHKIEDMGVLKMAVAVVSTVQNHRVFVDDAGAAVPGTRHVTAVLHLKKEKDAKKK